MALLAGFGLQCKNTFNHHYTQNHESGQRDILLYIMEGDFAKAGDLLQNKSDYNLKKKQEVSVLMMICKFCPANREVEAISLVEYLMNRGARLDKKDECGKTASYYAEKNGLRKITQLFQTHVTDMLLDQNLF